METIDVVIRIPKDVYIRIKKDDYDNYKDKGKQAESDILDLLLGLDNGTVLPKEHGRIGDLDELHHIFKELCNAYSINNLSFMSDMDMNFDLAPTIIEADKDSE